jgi:hypothetical protein
VCLDVGQKHAGAMVGLMNTSSQVGGLLFSIAYGYIVNSFGSYDAPFVPMAALLFLGAGLVVQDRCVRRAKSGTSGRARTAQRVGEAVMRIRTTWQNEYRCIPVAARLPRASECNIYSDVRA